MLSIWDLGDDRYTSQVFPELFRDPKPARVENWSAEEREMYCGIYTDDRKRQLIRTRYIQADWDNDLFGTQLMIQSYQNFRDC